MCPCRATLIGDARSRRLYATLMSFLPHLPAPSRGRANACLRWYGLRVHALRMVSGLQEKRLLEASKGFDKAIQDRDQAAVEALFAENVTVRKGAHGHAHRPGVHSGRVYCMRCAICACEDVSKGLCNAISLRLRSMCTP